MSLIKKIVAIATVFSVLSFVSPVFGATVEELQAQINQLLAQLTQLQTQLAALQGQPTVTGCTITSFDRNLKQGMSGDDVKCLQIILNSATDTQVATEGAGSPGNETTYFGPLTFAAVVKFQEKYASEILASWGITTGTGYVGSTTRAKLDSLLGVTPPPGVVCGNGVCETGETSTNCPADCPAVITGQVSVSLASDTPASTTLALGAVGVPVAIFNLTSGADNAVLDTIKFTRSGIGASTDYSNVYIYSGNTRLKSGRTISADSDTVEFTNIGLALPKGVTTKLTVKVDVYTAAVAGNIDILSIASAGDISITGATVAGTFPISANYMTFSTLSVGTVTVENGGSVSKPTLGQTEGLVAKIKITAGVNDIEIVGMTLNQNGSISNSNLGNLKLKIGSTVLATAASMTGDKVVLVLGTPYEITKSQNKTLYLYADILGGKTTDTIRFYLDETSDIQITDKKYSQGSAITNSFGSSAAYCVGAASNTCPDAGSLQGGAITLADNGPAAITVATNTTNVPLLNFGFTSSRNVTVKDYDLLLTATNKANGTITGDPAAMTIGTESAALTATSHGLSVGDYIIIDSDNSASYSTTIDIIAKVTTVTDANTIKVTPVSGTDLDAASTPIWSTILKISAVRVTDTGSGSVIYSNSTARYFYNGALTSAIAVSDDFDVNAGQTRQFSLRVDIHTYSAAGMTINGEVDFSTVSRIKDNDANEYVAVADIVPSTLTGKNMTTGAAGLTVALASTPVSGIKVKGTNDVDVLGISLTAGSSGNVKLTSLIVRFIADTTSTFGGGIGDTNPNTVVGSVNLYDGSTKIAGPKSIVNVSWTADDSGYYQATFDNLAYNITAGSSQKLTVKVDLKNTVSTETYLVATIAPADDVVAEDADGNSLTISNTANGGLNEDDGSATVMNDTTPPVQIDVKTAGTLSAVVEGSPDAAIVIAGKTGVVMAKYKFSALYEDFTIDKLEVASDTDSDFTDVAETTNDNNIVRVGVKAGGVTTWSNLSTGLAKFSGLNITVPAGGNTYVEILVDLNTIAGGADSGDTPRLGINTYTTTNTFRAVGVGSSEVKAIANVTFTGEANVNAMVLRKTAPTVAKVSGMNTTFINGQNTLYGFTVAADSAEAVSLKALRFKMAYARDLHTSGALGSFKFYRGSTDLTTTTVSIISLGDASLADNEDLEAASTDGLPGTGDDGATSFDGYVVVKFDKSVSYEEIISAGSSQTYYLKATASGVNTTSDSVSVYIADDTVSLGTTVAVNPTFYLVDDAGKVAWSAVTAQAGDYSAKATQDDDNAGVTGIGFVPKDAITFDTLAASLTNAWTYYYKAQDSGAWVYFEMRFEDPNSASWIEITDQVVNPSTSWTSRNLDTSTTFMYYTSGGYDSGIVGDLEAVYADAIANNRAEDDWVLQRVRSHVWEGNSKYVYFDDITIDGVTYAVEPVNFLWSDNSATSHTTRTADWINGYLVNVLPTDPHTLSY